MAPVFATSELHPVRRRLAAYGATIFLAAALALVSGLAWQ